MIVFVLRFPETDSAACEQQPVLGHAVRGGQDGTHTERLQQQPLPAVAAPQHDPERLIPHPTSSLHHFHLDQPWLSAPSPGGSSRTSHASPLCQTGQRLKIRAANDFPPFSQASLCAARHKFPGCSNYVSGGGDGCAYGDLSVQVEWRVASAHGQHCNQSRHRWASCSPPFPLCHLVCCLAGGQWLNRNLSLTVGRFSSAVVCTVNDHGFTLDSTRSVLVLPRRDSLNSCEDCCLPSFHINVWYLVKTQPGICGLATLGNVTIAQRRSISPCTLKAYSFFYPWIFRAFEVQYCGGLKATPTGKSWYFVLA